MRKEKRSCQGVWEVHSPAWIVSFLWVGCCWSNQAIIQWLFRLLVEKRFFRSLFPQTPIPAHTYPSKSVHVPLLPQETDIGKKSIKVIELILSWILWSNTLHSQVDTGARQEGVKEVTGCRGRGGEEWNSPFQQQPDLRQIKVTVQPRPLWVAPLISFWACEESAIAPAELRAAQTGFYHPIVLHLLNLWCALPEFLGGSVAIIGKLTKGQYHSSVRRPVCVQLL